MMDKKLYSGWGEADITPGNRVVELTGQYYQRVAEGIHSRLKATVLILEQAEECSAMISLDVVGVPVDFCRQLQNSIAGAIEKLTPDRIIINAIHTHNAPALSSFRNWWDSASEAISDKEFSSLIQERLIEATRKAWESRQVTGVANVTDFAVIGHCRRVVYTDNTAEMYGETCCDTFAGLEGSEDSGVELLFFCNEQNVPTGVIVNVACPSQVMEATYKISSDFMGALREKLKQEFGSEFKTLPQITAAGCQSPRDLTRNDKEQTDLWHEDGVNIIADRLLDTVKRSWNNVPEKLDFSPTLSHHYESLDLPKRRVDYADYIVAQNEITRLEKNQDSISAYQDFCKNVHENEKIDGRPGPYDNKNCHFVEIRNNEAEVKRYEEQLQEPELSINLHVLRLGNSVFATNPFELFLEFGQRIKARSQAKQTFVIQLANGYEGYLPSPRAEELGGYGGLIINGKIGSNGGCKLVDKSVKIINQLYC
jgi:hypothetical protein